MSVVGDPPPSLGEISDSGLPEDLDVFFDSTAGLSPAELEVMASLLPRGAEPASEETSVADLHLLSKGVNGRLRTVLGADKKLPTSTKSVVYGYVGTLVAVIERLTVMNAVLAGAVSEARRATKELRDELLRSVVEGMENGVKSVETRVQEGVSSLESAVARVSLQQSQKVARVVAAKGSECVRQVERVARSYAGVAASGVAPKSAVPNFSLRGLVPQPAEEVVLVFPVGGEGNSADTQKKVREAINPRLAGIQVKRVRGIRSGGVAVVVGGKARVREYEGLRSAGLRVVDPKVQRPRVMVYDVPCSVVPEELGDCVFSQGGFEGVSREEFLAGFREVSRVNAGEDGVNVVVKCSPKVRDCLRAKGRVFVEWNSCKVVDFVRPTRCYRCLAFGHVAAGCKSEKLCGHCGLGGHVRDECPKKSDGPVCVNCKRAGKDCAHDVHSHDCPAYERALERVVRMTSYE